MPIFCARLARYVKRTSWKFAHGRNVRANFRISSVRPLRCLALTLQGAGPRALHGTLFFLLAWRNWQTRTAQDRMGKPVEVRVLSRAVFGYLQRSYFEAETIGKPPTDCINRLSARRFPSRRPASLHQLREPSSAGRCEAALLG